MAAGALALAVSYLVRISIGGVFIPELGSQTFFSYVPTSVESVATESLGIFAKYITFVVAILVVLFIYGAIGLYLHRLFRKLHLNNPLVQTALGSTVSYVIFLLIGGALLELTVVTGQPVSLDTLITSSLPPQLAFGFVLSFLYSRELESKPHEAAKRPAPVIDTVRRRYIKMGIASAVALAILLSGVEIFLPKPTTEATLSKEIQAFFMNEVTANPDFYRVDINIEAPQVDVASWKLAVTGMVNSPLDLTYNDIVSMPYVEQYNTLECISNVVGGDLISNAKWRGVKLEDILKAAGASQEAVYVVFRCYDGYDVGIPIQKARDSGTILAYMMNDAQLPKEHGYPLRAVVPGLYGQHNAKWITEIQVVNEVYQGFWQRRGWANDATYKTTSTIVIPGNSPLRRRFMIPGGDSSVTEGTIPVAGIAFAGDRGIEKVEVSVDGGNTWQQASLKDPLSNYTWVLWSKEWNPPAAGAYKLMVRATDGEGNLQISTLEAPFPSGATGYQVIDVSVVS
ncbi:MAG: molybdopterin-dependent oxidoreductase [Nitrososphaerota archaeon]|nr:molybdopterin-dependent oxidoreductase [Nitrososphaerota archaeon]